MTFTSAQKELVQVNFADVAIAGDEAAELFYNRLFEIAPDTKNLFKSTDMKMQGQKLLQTLAVVIVGLDNLEAITDSVQALAKRHVAYGVKAEDYQAVGQALIWMLGEVLKEDFTDEAKDAWVAIYGLVANTAIDAAYTTQAGLN
jgi:hemoglobin-like flavoprotein